MADPWGTDVEPIVADAMEIMRLDPADQDKPRIDDAARTAVALITDHLDRGALGFTELDVPAPVTQAAAMATVEMYKRKDAPFGVLASWSESDFGPVRIGTDWLKGVEYLLSPYRMSFGVG